MKFFSWRLWLALSLINSSLLLYLINYAIFRDVNYMSRLFLAQLGFLPISVLLVTIIINQLLNQRAQRAKLGKLNMVIGAFFSEVGLTLLQLFARTDTELEELQEKFRTLKNWSDKDFLSYRPRFARYQTKLEIPDDTLQGLRQLLLEKRPFLLRLLENPNLLEHDSFSNLLWAVFHLTEELSYRQDLTRLGRADRAHLTVDTLRAYGALIGEWLAYLHHLKHKYPYLFSLALRLNPFDPEASLEVKEETAA